MKPIQFNDPNLDDGDALRLEKNMDKDFLGVSKSLRQEGALKDAALSLLTIKNYLTGAYNTDTPSSLQERIDLSLKEIEKRLDVMAHVASKP